MSLIKIISNNIELDFVKETLSIKLENNAFSNEFKVSYSIYPFLIIENKNCKIALGTREIASINKKKIIPVTVFEGGNKFYGEIQVLSYLNGFRKCNLKYSTEILTIMKKKLAEFMPIISVIPNEINPTPYTKESDYLIEGHEYWENYPIPFLNKTFPEVYWQFPSMDYYNKFGEILDPSEEWGDYLRKINNVEEVSGEFKFISNTYSVIGEANFVSNKNVVAPQVYLLTPLLLALQSLNFTATGDFYNSEFFKRIVFYSKNDNLTSISKYWIPKEALLLPNEWPESHMKYIDIPLSGGDYRVKVRFVIPDSEGLHPGGYCWIGNNDSFDPPFPALYGTTQVVGQEIFEIDYDFTANAVGVGRTLAIYYINVLNKMPLEYSVSIYKESEKKYNQFHPTIETARYVPDWTFGEYLNQLKITFNLDIKINDFKKEVSLNFVDDFILSECLVLK